MRERKDLSEYNIHAAVDIFVSRIGQARKFNRELKPQPLGPTSKKLAVAEAQHLVNAKRKLFGQNENEEAIQQSQYNIPDFRSTEIYNSFQEYILTIDAIDLLPDRAHHLDKIDNIENEGF